MNSRAVSASILGIPLVLVLLGCEPKSEAATPVADRGLAVADAGERRAPPAAVPSVQVSKATRAEVEKLIAKIRAERSRALVPLANENETSSSHDARAAEQQRANAGVDNEWRYFDLGDSGGTWPLRHTPLSKWMRAEGFTLDWECVVADVEEKYEPALRLKLPRVMCGLDDRSEIVFSFAALDRIDAARALKKGELLKLKGLVGGTPDDRRPDALVVGGPGRPLSWTVAIPANGLAQGAPLPAATPAPEPPGPATDGDGFPIVDFAGGKGTLAGEIKIVGAGGYDVVTTAHRSGRLRACAHDARTYGTPQAKKPVCAKPTSPTSGAPKYAIAVPAGQYMVQLDGVGEMMCTVSSDAMESDVLTVGSGDVVKRGNITNCMP